MRLKQYASCQRLGIQPVMLARAFPEILIDLREDLTFRSRLSARNPANQLGGFFCRTHPSKVSFSNALHKYIVEPEPGDGADSDFSYPILGPFNALPY